MSNNENNYWCYQCQLEIAPLMVPNPTCPWCRNDFVEEITQGNDPRDFMDPGSSEQEDENVHIGGSSNGVNSLIQLLSQIQNLANGENRNESSSNVSRENGVHNRDFVTTTTTTTVNSDGTHSAETAVEETNNEPEEPSQDSRVDSFLNFINLIMSTGENQSEASSTNEQVEGDPRSRNSSRATILTLNGNSGTISQADAIPSQEESVPNNTFRNVGSLLQLLTNMAGNPGDYAVGPNALDEIITRLMEHGSDNPANQGASEELINNLSKRIALEKDQFTKAECSICTDNFSAGDMLICLPCEHEYHSDCIVSWLKLNATCPICRYAITEEDVADDVISID